MQDYRVVFFTPNVLRDEGFFFIVFFNYKCLVLLDMKEKLNESVVMKR